jgi:hypothetical protein
MSKDQFFQMRQQELAHFVEQVEQGETSALISYANLKRTADEYASAIKQIESIAMEEAHSYGEKSFEVQGFKFEVRNGAKRFDYSNISEWKEIQSKLKETEEKYKSAFMARQKGLLTASEDGEELEMPELKISKDSLVLKK